MNKRNRRISHVTNNLFMTTVENTDKSEDFPIHRFHHAFVNDVFKSLSNMEQITIFSQLTVTLAFESFILTVIKVSVPPEAVLPAKRYTFSCEL